MDLKNITDWFDSFYEEYVAGKKLVRGRAFSGSHIQIWSGNSFAIVLHDPYPRGVNKEEKALDFARSLDDDVVSVYAEINLERLRKIVSGEQPLTNEDWVWQDE
jgi:hypothetical protein